MIPQELLNQPQWVCWRYGERNGKRTKLPINPKTGGGAMSNNESTWASYATATAAHDRHKDDADESTRIDGVGFMLANGYFGVDLDHIPAAISAYKAGAIDNIIAEFVHGLQSYAEYSVSGNGVHIICKGSLPAGGRRKGDVEMYDDRRYFAMTGDSIGDYTEIADGTEAIKPLHEKYIGGGARPSTVKPQPTNESVDDIITRALASRQGQTFGALLNGDWERLFTSQSEADMSFCNMLAFWTGKDPAKMDAIFRASGLMREKWNRAQSGSTYGALTINKAIRDCKETYSPPAPKSDYAVSVGAQGTRPAPHTFDDTGNAERIIAAYGDVMRYSFIAKHWLYYDGRRWLYDYDGSVRKLVDDVIAHMPEELSCYDDDVQETFQKHISRSRSSAAKAAMLKECEHKASISPDALDKRTDIINTPSGIVSLRTGELSPHDRGAYLSKITHAEVAHNADCPIWLEFLNTIFAGDAELIRYVQLALGYSLTGSTREQCVFFLYGDGRNGKSTFLDIISDMLGDYAINIQPETLMVKGQSSSASSDIARLAGARFVTSSEPSEGMRLNEGLLKQLTGGDKVTASKKYENEFEFRTEFKLWIAMNHRPIIRGTDTGIWRRIHLIPFTVAIPEDKVDRNLKHKLKREMPAIFAWCLEGCTEWQRVGKLVPPESVRKATDEYRMKMDTIGAFLAECCVVGEGETPARQLFDAYRQWAQANNEYVMTGTKFGTEISKRFEKRKDYRGNILYSGVRLINEFRPYTIAAN